MSTVQRPIAHTRTSELRYPAEGEEATSLRPVRLATHLLDHWRAILLGAVIGAALAVGLVLRRPVTYTASAQAVVDSRRSATVLADLTAQLGLGSLSSDGSPSPQFYSDLLTSRPVLGAVIDSVYRVTTDSGEVQGNLVHFYGIQGASEPLRRDATMRVLRGSISRSVAPRTGVITLSVRAPDPALAAMVAERLIAEVNRINVESRQSQASNEREFAGRRMREAAAELRVAEDALQNFLQQNRAARLAPRTAMEEDRLQRTVAMRQAIYTSVAQAYEQARIDEARDTPGLRIIEPPAVPVTRDPRGLRRAVVFGAALAGLLVGLVVMGRGYLKTAEREDPDAYTDFRRTLRSAAQDFVRPWRWFRVRRARAD